MSAGNAPLSLPKSTYSTNCYTKAAPPPTNYVLHTTLLRSLLLITGGRVLKEAVEGY